MNPFTFVQTYLGDAENVSAQTGLPVDYVLGQAALESGWGGSYSAQNRNNFFGISPGGQLASYGSPGASFQAFANLINGNYQGWGGNTAGQIGDSINGMGYSQTADYGSRVQGTTNTVDGVLASLGLGSLVQSGNASSPSSSSAAGSSNGGCGWCQQIEQWVLGTAAQAVPSWVFVVFGIILVIGAILMLANEQGAFKNVPPIILPVE